MSDENVLNTSTIFHLIVFYSGQWTELKMSNMEGRGPVFLTSLLGPLNIPTMPYCAVVLVTVVMAADTAAVSIRVRERDLCRSATDFNMFFFYCYLRNELHYSIGKRSFNIAHRKLYCLWLFVANKLFIIYIYFYFLEIVLINSFIYM